MEKKALGWGTMRLSYPAFKEEEKFFSSSSYSPSHFYPDPTNLGTI